MMAKSDSDNDDSTINDALSNNSAYPCNVNAVDGMFSEEGAAVMKRDTRPVVANNQGDVHVSKKQKSTERC